MPDESQPIDVQFPTNGIAISSGFFPDRPKTSQIANNVRAFDTILERQRGGSRAGISRYVDDQLGGTSGSFVFYDNVAGTNTWTAPTDLAGTIIVEVWGAGGGPSPTAGGSPSGTAGGGGGGYSRLLAFAATPGTSYTYTNGAGGSGSDGGDSSFNTASAVAHGGKANGTGATSGTGDFAFGGGNGGTSGVGLGGGGGGSSGYFFGNGNNGNSGSAGNVGGTGGTGFPESSATPQGAGGDGATGSAGSEVAAGNGSNPGGGGGGGCADTGGIDPAWLSSGAGADGAIKITYSISNPIQHLAQLTVLDEDLLISSFENYDLSFIPDPSTNNFPNGNPDGSLPDGYGIRNPGRFIPPFGGPGYPYRFRPASPRERLQVSPTSSTVLNGSVGVLNITLTNLPSSSPVASGVVKVQTLPRSRSGDGLSGTTNGSGQVSISVSEPTYEGTVLYIVTHEYTLTSGKKVTCSGTCKITWQANASLTWQVTGPNPFLGQASDGTVLFNYVGTVRNSSTGKPLGGRTVFLNGDYDLWDSFTNTWTYGLPLNVPLYPAGYVGLALSTDGSGVVRFNGISQNFFGIGSTFVLRTYIKMPVKNASGYYYTSNTATLTVFGYIGGVH